MATSISNLLKEPFGPYPDSFLLSENCKSTKTNIVGLESLILAGLNGDVVGLDDTETSPLNANLKGGVRFFGIIKLKSARNLSWLSEQGRKQLQKEMQARDVALKPNSTNASSSITLGSIFQDNPVFKVTSKLSVKVKICGFKNMPAVFLLSDLNPSALIFNTKDRNRNYEVLSMDVQSYDKSINFLERYRLLKFCEVAVAGSKIKELPLDGRTIDGFIDYYQENLAFTDYYRNHRDIYDPKDPDFNEKNETKTPRHPRHVSRAEICSTVAAHAEWLLGDLLAKRAESKKVIGFHSLYKFCQNAAKAREEAAKAGIRWGQPYGIKLKSDVDANILGCGIIGKTRKQLGDALVKAKGKKPITEKKAAPKKKAPSPTTMDVDSGEEFGRIYDPDYSEDSTSSWKSDTPEPSLEDTNMLANLPRCLWYAPELPADNFVWHCPVPGCTNWIDLLELSADSVEGLHPRDIRYLHSKEWSSIDETRVLELFFQMVSNHYKTHLQEYGVDLGNLHRKNQATVWEDSKSKVQ